jgi:hypothetical protein
MLMFKSTKLMREIIGNIYIVITTDVFIFPSVTL